MIGRGGSAVIYNGGLHVGLLSSGTGPTTGNLEVDNRAAIGGPIDNNYKLSIW